MTIAIWQLVVSILSLLLVIIALLATQHRFNMTLINRIRSECEQETKALHQRVNDVRDAYVRKEDLHVHLQPVTQSVNRLGEEIHRVTSRIDDLMKSVNSAQKEG